MTKKIINEISVTLILALLIIILLDLFPFWMPGPVAMIVLLALVLVYIVYAVFMWREKSQDEREDYHKLVASRRAWLSGSSVLIVAVLVQGINHDIDPWILYALLAMIIAKSITHIKDSIKN